MLDALLAFIRKHPKISSAAALHPLRGKTGLSFPEYALVVPNWKDGTAVLRLVRSGEDWLNHDPEGYYGMQRTVEEDVSHMSDNQLERLPDKLYHEANPEDFEDEKK
jgi:hypothetical protein